MLGLSNLCLSATKSRFLPFKEARTYARSLGFTKWSEWQKWASSPARPKNVPYWPYQFYKEFKSSPDWLGYEPRQGKSKFRELDQRRVQCGRDAYIVTSKIVNTVMNEIKSQMPTSELKHLRLGQQANLLLCVNNQSECQAKGSECALPSTNLKQDFNATLSGSHNEPEKKYMALQIKSASPTFNKSGISSYRTWKVTKHDSVAIILVTPCQQFVKTLLPSDRNLELEGLNTSTQDYKSISTLGQTILEWAHDQVLPQKSEVAWCTTLAARKRDTLREALITQLRASYFTKCNLDFQYVMLIGQPVYAIVGNGLRVLIRIAYKCQSGTLIVDNKFDKNVLICKSETEQEKESYDYFLILFRGENGYDLRGFFVFPSKVLAEFGALRSIYPAWITPRSKRAQHMQTRQIPYFVSSLDEFINLAPKIGIV